MTITNKLNLPEPIYQRAVQDSKSREGLEHFMSVTELINPPWLMQLRRKHYDEIEIDCGDLIWIMFGIAFHEYLAEGTILVEKLVRFAQKSLDYDRVFIDQLMDLILDVIPYNPAIYREERYYTDIAGERISGQIDYFNANTGELVDYKTTSVWTIKYGSRMSEWTLQANFYAQLLRCNGDLLPAHPTELKIVAVCRDWHVRDRGQKNYPDHQVVTIPLELYDYRKCKAFMEARVNLHKLDNPSPCSDQETWKGKRCADYCDVNKFCSKYKAISK